MNTGGLTRKNQARLAQLSVCQTLEPEVEGSNLTTARWTPGNTLRQGINQKLLPALH